MIVRNTSIVMALYLFASEAIAADPVPNTGREAIEVARHYMELGQEAYGNKEFEKAAAEFIYAFAASPFAAFLYNAGLAFEKAGQETKAVEYYRKYLETAPDAEDYAQVEIKIHILSAGISEEKKPETEVIVKEVEMKSLISVRTNPKEATVCILDAEGRVVSQTGDPTAQTVRRGAYTVEASHPDYRTVKTEIQVTPGQVYVVVVEMSQGAFLGFLNVVTDIPGALIYIDDKKVGALSKTPFGSAMPTGKHTMWIEKPGYRTIEREFEMALGKETKIEAKMERLSFGAVLVKANVSKATVYVDDKPLGQAPHSSKIEPGRHRLKVSADGMKDLNIDFEIKGGQQTKILVRMNPKPSRTSAWVSAGMSAAFLVGGTILGAQAVKIDHQLEKEKNNGSLTNNDPRIVKGFLFALTADVSLGVGAIIGGLSIYYFLRDPLPPSEGKVFAPEDFEENMNSEASAIKTENSGTEPAISSIEKRRLELSIAPILSPTSAGIGIAVAF